MISYSGFLKKNPVFSFTVLIFFLYFFSFLTTAEENPDPGSTLVACYFVGNDLESGNPLGDWGYFTQNLLDMRDGYGNGRGDDLKVVIAYGGANKEGWRGMHEYTLDNATADYLDNGQYDQWDSYTTSYPEYNMGSKESFEQFLKSLEPYQNYKRKYLIMGGHGGAYQGAFPDENYNTGNIPLPDMKKALEESGMHFDIIGMDTCLMGTIEVAYTLQDLADYLVASEETETGLGWNYNTLMEKLVGDPDINPEDLGKIIINSYIPNQLNEGRGTLSLIDLKKIPQVIVAWDKFSRELNRVYHEPGKKKEIERIISDADEFGLQLYLNLNTNERSFYSYTMDMKSFARDTGNSVPEIADDAEDVIEAVENAVIYTRQNLRPYATGLSVFSPLHKENTIEGIFEYSPSIAFSEEWYSFLIQFFRTVLADKQKPVMTSSPGGVRVEDDGYVSVKIEFSQINPEYDVILGSEPAYQSQSGFFSLPEWNGQAFHFINPVTGSMQIIPVFFQQQIDAETEEYYAYARISDEEKPDQPWIYFDIFFNSITGDTKLYYVYIGEDEDNYVSLSYSGRMNPVSDLDGSGIIPYALVRKPDGTTTWKAVTDEPFMITKEMKTGYQPVACGEYRYDLVATDLKGNGITGYEKTLTQPCLATG